MERKAKRSLRFGFLGRFSFYYLWRLTVLTLQFSFTFSEILVKPMNTMSFVGTTVKMECSISSSHRQVDWEFSPTGFNSYSFIYAHGRMTECLSSRYKIDTDNRLRYDLVIDPVNLSDAGTYRCIGGVESARAELVVIASYPVCTASAISYRGIYPNYHYYDADGGIMEGDYFRMECIVAYSGGYWPVTNGGNRSDGGGGYSESRNIKKSSTATRLTARDNGLTFTMKTTFERKYNFEPRANEAIATNVPPYQHLWKFKVNVLYGVRNLTTEHNGVTLEVGDQLLCWADGNPSPTLTWTEIGTNRITNGPILTVDKRMALMQNLTYQCTATNTLAGNSSSISDVVTFAVTEPPHNLRIEPKRDIYEVGDRLVCWADGNPSPTYKWTEIGINRVVDGPILTIDKRMALMQNLTFKCTATNTLTGSSSSISDVVTFTVTATSDTLNVIIKALAVVGAAAAIGLLALGLVMALKSCRKGNQTIHKVTRETSIQQQDYEIVVETNMQSGDNEHPPLNENKATENDTRDHPASYSSLIRGSETAFAEPAVYAQIELYTNASSNDA